MKFALNKVNLLVLGDFGLNPLTPQNKRDLFAILEARVGSQSTAILGQMDMAEWHSFIDDDAIADAIMDRLIHSSHRLPLKGSSMRDGMGPAGEP
jgi:DNA replication protein DnaC